MEHSLPMACRFEGTNCHKFATTRKTERSIALGFSLIELPLFDGRTSDPLGFADKVAGLLVPCESR